MSTDIRALGAEKDAALQEADALLCEAWGKDLVGAERTEWSERAWRWHECWKGTIVAKPEPEPTSEHVLVVWQAPCKVCDEPLYYMSCGRYAVPRYLFLRRKPLIPRKVTLTLCRRPRGLVVHGHLQDVEANLRVKLNRTAEPLRLWLHRLNGHVPVVVTREEAKKLVGVRAHPAHSARELVPVLEEALTHYVVFP